MKRNLSSAEKEIEPLDSSEQEKIVEEFRSSILKQSSDTRLVFTIVFLGIAVLFAFCEVYSFVIPWSFHHQMALKDLIPMEAFRIYYFTSAISFLALSYMVRNAFENIPKMMSAFVILSGALSLVAWSVIFWAHAVTHIGLYWLPLANLAGIGVALYIDRDSKSLLKEVDKLDKSRYEFKKI